MAITLLDQETQVRNTAPVAQYDDTVAPTEANYETNPANLEDDLNNMRSMLSHLRDNQAGDWFDALTAATGLDTGSIRGVQDVNQDLHDLEKRRLLVPRKLLVDITVAASENWVLLGVGEIPTQTTAAVGAVTTKGTVVAAHGGTFDTHSLAEVAGAHALAPKNLLEITDAGGDPILSGGRRIWGLLHGEASLTDGGTITASGGAGDVQVSFVRPTAAHTDLEACPVADIENQTIRYCYVERIANDELTEQDFLARGAAIDIGAGAGTVDRQTAYDNQGATAVDLTTNATLDLEGAGLIWAIRDDAEADLFRVVEGSAGGTSTINFAAGVDTFDNDAVANDFLNGVAVDTGAAGTTINVGVTANQIDSGGALRVESGAGADLTLDGTNQLIVTDGFQAGSGFATALVLSDTSDEWDDFETKFGEVSLLNAICQAKATVTRRVLHSIATVAAAADANVSGPAGDNNLDTDLGDLSGLDFGLASSQIDVYLNGVLQVQDSSTTGANNKDVYPGTSLAAGQLKFEKKIKVGDVICIVDWAELP